MNRRRDRVDDVPLLAWGDALRARKTRRTRLRRRIVAVGLAIGALGLTIAMPPAPWFVWNASASAPIGLYQVTQHAPIEPGEMVVARVPLRYRQLAATRRYIPLNVPLVKHVAAYAGDEVCALGQDIFVNGSRVAGRRFTDAQGRPMPMWSGCTILRGGQLFLLMDNPASFDGRYFGPTEGKDIVGKARLLWRR